MVAEWKHTLQENLRQPNASHIKKGHGIDRDLEGNSGKWQLLGVANQAYSTAVGAWTVGLLANHHIALEVEHIGALLEVRIALE